MLNAGAQLIDTDNQRAALGTPSILLGRVPSTFALERSETYALKLPAVAASVPSELCASGRTSLLLNGASPLPMRRSV